jgi:hypothetical protein
MRIADTERQFLRIVRERGREVAALRPDEAVDVMLEFYRSVRSPEVEPQQGDALLYQWGIFDWGKGEYFEFDLTRQLIRRGGTEDSDINQLHLTLRFSPTRDLKAIPASNKWCWSLGEAAKYESFIRQSAAFKAVSALSPSSVSVTFGEV